MVQKVNYFTNNKWVKLDVCENEDGDLSVNQLDKTTQFKKRGGNRISVSLQAVILKLYVFYLIYRKVIRKQILSRSK